MGKRLIGKVVGQPGKTPEKGKDYWTEKEKEEMITEVIKRVNLQGISELVGEGI